MRGEGISILLVEQNVRAATEIADRAYVLDDGRVVFSGAAGEFAQLPLPGQQPQRVVRPRFQPGLHVLAEALIDHL